MRSQRYWWVAGLAALSLFAGCAFPLGGSGIRGSGPVKTQSRPIAEFSSISFKSEGRVTVQQTGKESLTISAEENLLPLLESRVTDRMLYLGTVNNTDIDPTKPIEFVVEVKNLEGLNMTGVGSIEAKGVQGKRLVVSLTGVGDMTIAGSADVLDLTLSGVGSYRGEAFKTKQAIVRSSGVGSVVVNVSEQLDASVSGVGSVEYVGSPQVQKSGRGVGTVKQR
jgi:Putative auto-transporter adhesin, head GIN domain